MQRKPAVAGYFYPGNHRDLRAVLSSLVEESFDKIKAKGVVVPHAGYMYSGAVAGKVYGKIIPPEVAVILGPNHTGLGTECAIFPGDSFLTPLGEVKIEKKLVKALLEKVPFLKEDSLAHTHEHSIEVQIPFLQYLNPIVKIIPICLGRLDISEIELLGDALGESVFEHDPEKVLIVASTDFSHYVPHDVAKQKDMLAIEEIKKLSEEGLLKVVLEENISMCGVIPVCVAIRACKKLGAEKGELIQYMTSGDVIQDYSSVVGYGGLIIY
jgi:AmmeMemoRadiSam system protein B